MAINKKLLHFKTFANFNSQKLSANEDNTSYTIGVDGAVTSGAPVVRYESICWIKDTKQMWTHGQLYDCSGGDVTSDSTTFLRVGDADDEAKANFIAVANGEKSADYYICASSIIGVETNGVVPSLIFNGPSNNPEQVYYTFLGSPMQGQMKNKVLMITTTLTVSDNTITTTYEAVLDNKQDTLVSGTNIKTINGNSILGSGNLTISPSTPILYVSATSAATPIPMNTATVVTMVSTTSKTFSLATNSAVTNPANLTTEQKWSLIFGVSASLSAAPTITFNTGNISTLYWVNGTEPTFEVGKYYEVSFLNAGGVLLGVCGTFSASE